MDYEKKYNEALERARKIHNEIVNNEVIGFPGQITDIFPELRESEDERIRKEIISALKFANYDGVYDKHIAWLEKQKESLHVPESCKENPDSFTDEHPNIIYTEMGEEFAKQKEQKPNIELIQRSWYMEGYHDREFGKEPKWILKTGEGGPKHELNPRYGQSLAEQQPTEQQMHDLNEAIKELRMDGCERIADSLHSLYIFLKSAYHQPMQEQKPVGTINGEPIPTENQSVDIPLAEWNKEDENRLNAVVELLENTSAIHPNYSRRKLIIWLKSLRPQPKQEWSEEDEAMRANILNALTPNLVYSCGKGTSTGTSMYKYDKEINWLKSLRPQWKPTEEQMEALESATENCAYSEYQDCLRELIKQLKNR